MAEAALFLVVQRIATYLGEEAVKLGFGVFKDKASHLRELPARMKRIRREFVVMQAFLSSIDTHRHTNKTLEAWSKEVKKIAYAVEDIVDEYVYLKGRQMKHTRIRRFLSCIHLGNIIFISPKNLPVLDGIATNLKEIESDLQNVIEMKARWINMNGGGGTQLQVRHLAESSESESCGFNKEDNLVGVEENKKLLHEWLADDYSNKSLSIISVWGKGGIGKSSLVTDVYTNAAKKFECRAWISVPRSYEADNLLRDIIKNFYGNVKGIPPKDVNTMDHRRLVEEIQSFLRQRIYLLVLDDVWNLDVFQDIRKALDNEDGGNVIITTRHEEVASEASENRRIELHVLNNEKEGWDLFCKRAFWNEGQTCPQQLEKVAIKILDRCGGLPLAIVIIASLLSRIQNRVSDWEKIYQQLDWEFNNHPELDPVQHALSLSYNYLSRGLKNCFLYCSVFPRDCLIDRNKLIRLWVAEGFLKERGRKTMEEVGNDNVNELVHRRLLQSTNQKLRDLRQPKRCWMNNLVREFAISTSKKESFAVICDDKGGFIDEYRRLSVHKLSGDGDDIQRSIHLPHLRTLLLFYPEKNSLLLQSVSLSSKYLSVLDLDGGPVESIPDEVGDLYNLRYLGLRKTKVKQLPKTIRRLNNLQTLDLGYTEIEELPRGGFIKLTKLRHLLAVKVNDPSFRAFDAKGGLKTPMEILNFKDLKNLTLVEATVGFIRGLEQLTQLRELGICKLTNSQCSLLSASLPNLRSLYHLEIIANNKDDTLEFKALVNPPQHLHTLELRGRLEEGVESPLFKDGGRKMRRLILGWSGLTKDPLPSLSTTMPGLTYLNLQTAYQGHILHFRKEWFPKLKKLVLGDMDQLYEVVIEERALQSLEYLELGGLMNMKELPQGIEYLKSLQVLWLRELHPMFGRYLEKSGDKDKVKHIPKVTIISKIGEKYFQETL